MALEREEERKAAMDYRPPKPTPTQPRIIIHGGAGNITRENLPPESQEKYSSALLRILSEASSALSLPGASALDVATHAVSRLEDDPLFNAGRGAVFTRGGTHELEASVMTSRGFRKRGVGVMKVSRARNPVKVAREMLLRGELGDGGGGAYGHCQLEGATVDGLAERWGLEMVRPGYFWTRRRWDEHRKGLGLSHGDGEYERGRREADGKVEGVGLADVVMGPSGVSGLQGQGPGVGIEDAMWDGREYLPQGTVGAVVLDGDGMVCVATSTGGLTNKLPGRIGDTPTLGSGFWAEQWIMSPSHVPDHRPTMSPLGVLLGGCLPGLLDHPQPSTMQRVSEAQTRPPIMHAVAMSGTGNGDSFLRLNAVRTAAAIARFSGDGCSSALSGQRKSVSLQDAVTAVAGPYGMLQQSAEDRWKKTGEGEGGIIGIDFADGKSSIVSDFNCGGMFHAWIDDDGKSRVIVFRDEY